MTDMKIFQNNYTYPSPNMKIFKLTILHKYSIL